MLAFLKLVYEPGDAAYPPLGKVVTLSSPLDGAPARDAARRHPRRARRRRPRPCRRRRQRRRGPDLDERRRSRTSPRTRSSWRRLDAAPLPGRRRDHDDRLDVRLHRSRRPRDRRRARAHTVVETSSGRATRDVVDDAEAMHGDAHRRSKDDRCRAGRSPSTSAPESRAARHLHARDPEAVPLSTPIGSRSSPRSRCTACSPDDRRPHGRVRAPSVAAAALHSGRPSSIGARAAAAVDARGVVVTTRRPRRPRAGPRRPETQWEAARRRRARLAVIDGDLVVVPATAAGGRRVRRARPDLGRRALASPLGDRARRDRRGRDRRRHDRVYASNDGRLVAVETGTGRALVGRRSKRSSGPAGRHVSPRGALAIDPATGVVAFVATSAAAGRWCASTWIGGRPRRVRPRPGRDPPPSAVATVGDGTLRRRRRAARGRSCSYDLEAPRPGRRSRRADAFDPASIPLVVGGPGGRGRPRRRRHRRRHATGTLGWRAELGEPVLDARPLLAGGAVHVVDWTGRVHRLRLADGRHRRRRRRPGVRSASSRHPARRSARCRDPRRGSWSAAGEGQRSKPASDRGVTPRSRPGDRPLQCSSEPGQSTRTTSTPVNPEVAPTAQTDRRSRGRKQNQGRRGRGRRDHEATAGGRSPLRSPDPALEPEDAAIHLRRAQRHLHRRPAPDARPHRHRVPVRPRHRRRRRHRAVRRHEEAGAGAGRDARRALGHAVHQLPLARRHAHELPDRARPRLEAPRAAARRRLRRDRPDAEEGRPEGPPRPRQARAQPRRHQEPREAARRPCSSSTRRRSTSRSPRRTA